MELDRILVATDLGPDADEAIRQGYAWAKIYDAELIFCTVLPTPFVRPVNPLDRDHTERALTMVRARISDVIGSTCDETHVLAPSGAPFIEICRIAAEHEAGLVVLGSGLRRGRPIMGGTAEKVVRSCRALVLIARPSPATGSVLAATDLSDPCFPVIAAGADYAGRRGGRLSVLHCLEPQVQSLPYAGVLPDLPHALGALRSKGAEALSRAMMGLEVEGRRIIESAPTRAAILRKAHAESCEVVVVGTSGRKGLARLALGNLAESILRAAPCSTLVVRLGRRHADIHA